MSGFFQRPDFFFLSTPPLIQCPGCMTCLNSKETNPYAILLFC